MLSQYRCQTNGRNQTMLSVKRSAFASQFTRLDIFTLYIIYYRKTSRQINVSDQRFEEPQTPIMIEHCQVIFSIYQLRVPIFAAFLHIARKFSHGCYLS